MSGFRIVTDIDECRHLWQQAIPRQVVTDLWEVRECFHKHFRNTPHFITQEDADGVTSFLPLCRIDELGYFGYFPGESWQGKTWLEQNRIVSPGNTFAALLEQCPSPHYLRYMLPRAGLTTVDEIGYLFEPPRYDYDMENYFQEFSQKSRKRLKKDMARFEAPEVGYRYDDPSDFDHVMRLSIDRFGPASYFHDPRFREGFRSLMNYLRDNGMLRITTVLIDAVPAAVDMGSIYNGTYTLLAGATHPGYPGVAKLINLRHMTYACEQKLAGVDFLCGDFSWKTLFHLTPRPLYLLSDLPQPPHGEHHACRTD